MNNDAEYKLEHINIRRTQYLLNWMNECYIQMHECDAHHEIMVIIHPNTYIHF